MERRFVVCGVVVGWLFGDVTGGNGSAHGAGDRQPAAPNLAHGPTSPFLAGGRVVLRAARG